MSPNECPVCGSDENPKFSDDSDWCVKCSTATIEDQMVEWASDSKVTHEVI